MPVLLMRFFFEIAYNGKNYAGWQSQANAIGVQAIVEEVLSKIFRTEIKIVGSGRTDTGVHCEQQFFHVDIDKSFDRDVAYSAIKFISSKGYIYSIH